MRKNHREGEKFKSPNPSFGAWLVYDTQEKAKKREKSQGISSILLHIASHRIVCTKNVCLVQSYGNGCQVDRSSSSSSTTAAAENVCACKNNHTSKRKSLKISPIHSESEYSVYLCMFTSLPG